MYRQKSSHQNHHDIGNTNRQQMPSVTKIQKDSKMGIKIVSKISQDNNLSQHKSQPPKEESTKPSQIKGTAQNPKKIARQYSSKSIKGLQVISSSRQSSAEKYLKTSRQNSQQAVVIRQIKSQAFISQFYPLQDDKKQEQYLPPLKQSYLSMENIQRIYKQKMSLVLQRQNNMFDQQIYKLRSIIKQNERRIDNLIYTLNVLIESSQDKGLSIEKCEVKVTSLQKYLQKSYEYCMTRIKDVQIIQKQLKNAIQSLNINNNTLLIQNKCTYLNDILQNVFVILRQNYHNQQQLINKEMNEYQRKFIQWDNKTNLFKQSAQTRRQISIRQHRFQTQFNKVKEFIKENVKANGKEYQKGKEGRFNINDLSMEEIKVKLQCIELKLSRLQEQKQRLEQGYKQSEEKSKRAIWQLSNLLNTREKDLKERKQQIRSKQLKITQRQSYLRQKQRQNESLSSYNRQLQNQLIESKYRQDTLRSDISLQLRYIQQSPSKAVQQDRLQKQNQVFRQRYEQLFRHNQYLQGINCKDKLTLLNNQKLIRQLYQEINQKNQLFTNKQSEVEQLQKQIQKFNDRWNDGKAQQLQANVRHQQLSRDLLLQKQKYGLLLNMLKSKQQQLQEVSLKMNKAEEHYVLVADECKTINDQLQQEYAYTHHLQCEVQRLNSTISQYTLSFTTQSQVFKQTIAQLKKQNNLLKQQLQHQHNNKPNSHLTTNNQPNSSLKPLKQPQFKKQQYTDKCVEGNRLSNDASQSQRLVKLRKAFVKTGQQLPVICQIDHTGYLKYYHNSTYIIDEQQNLFDLQPSQIQQGIAIGLIQFIHQ